MNWKLAIELRKRGLPASSNRELGLLGKKDGALIKALAESHEPCVLVAWDNKMAQSHREALGHFNLTLAVVDEKADRGDLSDEQYYREVIHRHAHRMLKQKPGQKMKYSRSRSTTIRVSVPTAV